MLQATENQTIMWGKHEVTNKRFNKSNKTDLPQVRLYFNKFKLFSKLFLKINYALLNNRNNNSFRVNTNAEFVKHRESNDALQKRMHV